MQSLSDLNNYSNTSVEYVDLRPPEIKFSGNPVNRSTSAYQTKSFSYSVLPGVEVTSIVSGTANYSFDLSQNSTMQVVWPSNLPDHLTISIVGRVYSVTGLRSATDWQLVRAPTIMGTASNSPFSFTATINFEGALTTWDTSVSIMSLTELSNATGDATYSPGVASLVLNSPRVVDDIPGFDTSSYTLTIQLDADSLGVLTSTNGTQLNGGKTLQIVGSLEQVNTDLNSLRYTSPEDYEDTVLINYSLWNPVSDFRSVKDQYCNSNAYQYLSTPLSINYDKNLSVTLTNTPIIIDTISGPGNYSMTVFAASVPESIATLLSPNGTFADGVLTLTPGTKEEINSYLQTITLQPGLNYTSDFVLKYRMVAPGGAIQSKKQSIKINNVNTTVTIDELDDQYLANYYLPGIEVDVINTPALMPTAIIPFVSSSYTMSVSTTVISAGTFNFAGSTYNSNTYKWSLTGTSSQIESALSTLKFTASETYTDTIVPVFELFNPTASFYSVEIMPVTDNSGVYLSAVTRITYDKNQSTPVTGAPQIIFDNSVDIYTMVVSTTQVNQVSEIKSAGVLGGVVTWDGSLVITGTKEQINSHLSTMTIQPWLNGIFNFNLRYLLSLNSVVLAKKVQQWNFGSANTVIPIDELTTGGVVLYNPGGVATVTDSPKINATTQVPFATKSYTLTITPSEFASEVTLAMPGATFNTTTRVLSITGSSSTINSALDTLTMTTTPQMSSSILLNYVLTNPTVPFTSLESVAASDATDLVFNHPTNFFYDKNQSTPVLGSPQIIIESNTDICTVEVTASPTNAMSSLRSAGIYGGTSTFANNKLTIVGTKSQVNNHLATLTMQPGLNYIQNFILYYHLTVAGGAGGIRPHNAFINNASAVVTLNELSNPSHSYYDTNSTHVLYNPVGSVEIDPVFNSSAMTMIITLTSGIGSLTTAGSGGSVSGIGTSTITIAGVNKSQLNSYLNTVAITGVTDTATRQLSYNLHNPSADFYSVRNVNVYDRMSSFLGSVTDGSYWKNRPAYFVGGNTAPLIASVNAGPEPVTYSVTSDPVATIHINGTYGNSKPVPVTVTGFNTNTITGSIAEINAALRHIDLIHTRLDYTGDYTLTFRATNAEGVAASKASVVHCTNTDTGLWGANKTRTFLTNTPAQQIFYGANYDFSIIEEIAGATYTVNISTTAGYFAEYTSTSASWTGTKGFVLTSLNSVYFSPIRNLTGTQTIHVTLYRGATLLNDENVVITGVARTPMTPVTYTYTSNSTFYPTVEEQMYAYADITVIAGGGGGGGKAILSASPSWKSVGGGGGGGMVSKLSNQVMHDYATILVGGGGAAGVTSTKATKSGCIGKAGGYGGLSSYHENGDALVIESFGGEGGGPGDNTGTITNTARGGYGGTPGGNQTSDRTLGAVGTGAVNETAFGGNGGASGQGGVFTSGGMSTSLTPATSPTTGNSGCGGGGGGPFNPQTAGTNGKVIVYVHQ